MWFLPQCWVGRLWTRTCSKVAVLCPLRVWFYLQKINYVAGMMLQCQEFSSVKGKFLVTFWQCCWFYPEHNAHDMTTNILLAGTMGSVVVSIGLCDSCLGFSVSFCRPLWSRPWNLLVCKAAFGNSHSTAGSWRRKRNLCVWLLWDSSCELRRSDLLPCADVMTPQESPAPLWAAALLGSVDVCPVSGCLALLSWFVAPARLSAPGRIPGLIGGVSWQLLERLWILAEPLWKVALNCGCFLASAQGCHFCSPVHSCRSLKCSCLLKNWWHSTIHCGTVPHPQPLGSMHKM